MLCLKKNKFQTSGNPTGVRSNIDFTNALIQEVVLLLVNMTGGRAWEEQQLCYDLMLVTLS